MELKYTEIDVENSNKATILAEIERLTFMMNNYKNLEQGLKIFINSAYGAIGNSYFICYNPDVAASITLQGQDLIKNSQKYVNYYFNELWHKDKELHTKMGIQVTHKVLQPVAKYGDTDSVASDSYINCENNIKINIEEMFMQYSKMNGFYYSHRGDEIVDNKDNMILIKNYDDNKGIYDSKIKRIIRHKVTKKKWKIKTKSGKELYLTNDHSVIVFRSGKKMEIKPGDILKTDKILVIK